MDYTTTIEIVNGNDRTITFSLSDEDTQEAIDLTGGSIIFSVKDDRESTTALLQRKNVTAGGDDSQVLISATTTGELDVYLIPSNTSDMEEGTYWYDLNVTVGGKISTPAIGMFVIIKGVTT